MLGAMTKNRGTVRETGVRQELARNTDDEHRFQKYHGLMPTSDKPRDHPGSLSIALVGCGTVGTGVAKILTQHAERVASAAGRAITIRHVVVRDPRKDRPEGLPAAVTSYRAALSDPQVTVVVELIGGTTAAKQVVLDAIAAGKHVVTANKALLAEHGAELFAAARNAHVAILFEAAVAGGVPIIRTMAESLAANQIRSIQAILNGTSNFILTAMAEQGQSYAAALREAQRLGYAEADPTLDVNGADAAHKLAVLAQIAFGVSPRPDQIERRGIDAVDALDVRFAGELGYAIKLLAEAWTSPEPEHTVALHVAPVMVRKTDLLARVRGPHNAVQLVGDVVGEVLLQGPGAGMMATASAVVSDLIDLAIGRGQLTFASTNLWSESRSRFTITRSDSVSCRFYLRLLVKDVPGVLADVCRSLADQSISITSVIQHEAEPGVVGVVPLVILTHEAVTSQFRKAVASIDRLTSLNAPAVYYPVDD
jgi:homoserine dehydrogenase